jgi:AMME syndrome candidate gene 1 protein
MTFVYVCACRRRFVVVFVCWCWYVMGMGEARISLLTDFEDAASYRDWTIGTHGIQITFSPPSTSPSASDAPSPLSSAVSLLSRPLLSSLSHSSSPHSSHSSLSTTSTTSASIHRRTLSATYLPEVAPDQGWGHIDAIDSAIRKAGWHGRISEDLRRSVRVRRYRSRKSVVGWDEFVAWRAERGVPIAFDLLDDHEGYDHHGREEEEEEEDEEDEGGF